MYHQLCVWLHCSLNDVTSHHAWAASLVCRKFAKRIMCITHSCVAVPCWVVAPVDCSRMPNYGVAQVDAAVPVMSSYTYSNRELPSGDGQSAPNTQTQHSWSNHYRACFVSVQSGLSSSPRKLRNVAAGTGPVVSTSNSPYQCRLLSDSYRTFRRSRLPSGRNGF